MIVNSFNPSNIAGCSIMKSASVASTTQMPDVDVVSISVPVVQGYAFSRENSKCKI